MEKFPKQRQGHQSDISKPQCHDGAREEQKNLLTDIESFALESDTGRKRLARDFAHSDLGLLPMYPWKEPRPSEAEPGLKSEDVITS